VSYALFDEKIKKSIMEVGVIIGLGLEVLPQTKLPQIDRELQVEAEKGAVKISESWDEIAKWIGATPEVLKATISEYNAYCDDGYDKVFAKDRRYLDALRIPPYYALKCYAGFLGTIGGIKINYHMEVLDHDDNPIPGLYAGGIDTGGWETDTYNVELAGAALGFAINSGRIAGENAAKYVRTNK
jgi:fumarate reductase flavoprotein subunit